ncbi:MAG: VCBS repeat-containing protein [Saprospiraceae bacterium]|nr:VCBS repeat-containing protein [Bacteroidia bacterium]NNE14328.1 VCBS repeat-containing protein [Saprospiraceae bacterium]
MTYCCLFFCVLFFSACDSDKDDQISTPDIKFDLLPASQTGVDFINQLSFNREFNIYTYRNFYNGGGVAIGDINNDGLPDIYFTSNMESNKLYINKGDFTFEDITEKAGIKGSQQWSTGTTMVDINQDGWLDIYVCNSGDLAGDSKANELFVNNGDGTFSEQAKLFGLDDKGYSTHAVFFDYDKDGDLDAYLLNNSYQAIGSFNLKKQVRENRDPIGGDKLLNNDNGKFTDVSEAAGIYGSVIGFGLGVTVGDIDNDGWDDIYVSNDFFEKDYLYINNRDGTFSEEMEDRMNSISVASMGADLADINNDGLPEIFVTEMLPSKDRRLKTKTTFEDWDKYQSNLKNGYYHQFTRNMLHLNQPSGKFAEIGRYCNVEATDWSWGALIADLDNDGFKDIFVANGIYQDLTDQDFINYIADSDVMASMVESNKVNYEKLIEAIPSEPIPNHFFKNINGRTFEDKSSSFGFDMPSHSNGSAYADLDLDGDLDLVINNVNMPAFIYRNNSSTFTHYLQLKLKYKEGNINGIGSKVTLHTKNQKQYFDFMPMKGFQSSMDQLVHFGLGDQTEVDSISILWPDLSVSSLNVSTVDTLLNIDYSKVPHSTRSINKSDVKTQLIFKKAESNLLNFTHVESNYVDFDKDRLLFHMNSNLGPAINVSDLNNDKLDDLIITNASGAETAVYSQTPNGALKNITPQVIKDNAESEDVDCMVFDVNGDNLLDIYLASCSSEFSQQSSKIKDRLYTQTKNGDFEKAHLKLGVSNFINSVAVDYADFDEDGDMDILLAERQKAGQFGVPCNAYVLRNDLEKGFTNITADQAPQLLGKGIYSDIHWADMDNDGDQDIVYCGIYMEVGILWNDNNSWTSRENSLQEVSLTGWWNDLNIVDVNNDGRLDIIAGNHGLNSRFKAQKDKPVCLHINDFDRNGSIEQILCRYEGDKSYPLALRHDIVKQLPHLKKKYLKYENYANQTIEDIFSEEERKNMLTLKAENLSTSIFLNTSDGFKSVDLPDHVQYSPVYCSVVYDFNKDGIKDVLLGGNFDGAKPEVGRYDANYGVLLLGTKDGKFQYLDNSQSGLMMEGEVRDMAIINISGKDMLVAARNNDTALIFEIN